MQNSSLHCLHKHQLSFAVHVHAGDKLYNIMLAYLSYPVVELVSNVYLLDRRGLQKGFPSKLGLPPLHLTDAFTMVLYFSTICSTNVVQKFNVSNLFPFFCVLWEYCMKICL